MKKLITIILTILVLTSCGMTQQEQLQVEKDNNIIKEYCKSIWYDWWQNWFWDIFCSYHKLENPVMKCIKEYTNWLDEKYNNPDIISNLREDDYSNVVKTCDEIFWNK